MEELEGKLPCTRSQKKWLHRLEKGDYKAMFILLLRLLPNLQAFYSPPDILYPGFISNAIADRLQIL